MSRALSSIPSTHWFTIWVREHTKSSLRRPSLGQNEPSVLVGRILPGVTPVALSISWEGNPQPEKNKAILPLNLASQSYISKQTFSIVQTPRINHLFKHKKNFNSPGDSQRKSDVKLTKSASHTIYYNHFEVF